MQLETGYQKIQRLVYQMHLNKLTEIYLFLTENGVEPILIKGAAAAANYPEPFQRVFGDIDLAVDSYKFEHVKTLAREKKYNVDLHCGLRHLDTVEWEDLFENSRYIKLNGVDIRVLRPEDHLRVMCVHWLNDGGADRTRLWDIYFALKRIGAGFDPERFLGVVPENRKKWLLTVLGVVRDYTGLPGEAKILEPGAEQTPLWIKKTLEKEWKNDERLVPLQRIRNDPRLFFRQVLRRVPPNALQALVENEGTVGPGSGTVRRLTNVLQRAKPSIRRLLGIDPDI